MADPSVRTTGIPGLLVVELDVRADNRGWFKENWQRRKMVDAGLPDFAPVQNNVSFNTSAGATRGIHAEPWDKLVSVTTGRIFGAWVDLRPGPGFGRSYTLEIGPETAVFVPRGVGNAFQTLVDHTAYSYLVNDHWSPAARDSYTFLNLADETVGIGWPIPLGRAELSPADRSHPRLADVVAMAPADMLVLGAGGQLGQALVAALPDATAVDRDELDLSRPESIESFDFSRYGTVINAAAYTAVDAAETAEGRRAAWATNVDGVAALVAQAREHRATLVHISSDYVFDGTVELHREDERFSPLGVYGQTKAAADALVATLARHYILRTSWVIGEGKNLNFVRTMADLADRGVSPSVVADQYGRLTFTSEIARAIGHLLHASGGVPSGISAPYGVYNITSDGPTMSWADIARAVFTARGRDAADVRAVTAEEYGAGRALAPRPRHSTLDLTKIRSVGFRPAPVERLLADYLGSG